MAEAVTSLIVDANLLVAMAVAFVAGIVSFASPCVIPLVPGYLSYMTGLSGDELTAGEAGTGRMLVGSSLFVVGFAVPFTMLGVAFGALSFLQQSLVARVAMGLVVAALGVLMARGSLVREVRLTDRLPGGGGVASAPALGFVFGVGWTPCIGPALGAILTLAAATTTGASLRGGVLGFVFALGLGLPFVLVGVAFRRLTGAVDLLRRNARRLQIAGGGLLTLVGVAIATGLWARAVRALRPLITGFTPPI